jgi:hypothetical protein
VEDALSRLSANHFVGVPNVSRLHSGKTIVPTMIRDKVIRIDLYFFFVCMVGAII